MIKTTGGKGCISCDKCNKEWESISMDHTVSSYALIESLKVAAQSGWNIGYKRNGEFVCVCSQCQSEESQ